MDCAESTFLLLVPPNPTADSKVETMPADDFANALLDYRRVTDVKTSSRGTQVDAKDSYDAGAVLDQKVQMDIKKTDFGCNYKVQCSDVATSSTTKSKEVGCNTETEKTENSTENRTQSGIFSKRSGIVLPTQKTVNLIQHKLLARSAKTAEIPKTSTGLEVTTEANQKQFPKEEMEFLKSQLKSLQNFLHHSAKQNPCKMTEFALRYLGHLQQTCFLLTFAGLTEVKKLNDLKLRTRFKCDAMWKYTQPVNKNRPPQSIPSPKNQATSANVHSRKDPELIESKSGKHKRKRRAVSVENAAKSYPETSTMYKTIHTERKTRSPVGENIEKKSQEHTRHASSTKKTCAERTTSLPINSKPSETGNRSATSSPQCSKTSTEKQSIPSHDSHTGEPSRKMRKTCLDDKAKSSKPRSPTSHRSASLHNTNLPRPTYNFQPNQYQRSSTPQTHTHRDSHPRSPTRDPRLSSTRHVREKEAPSRMNYWSQNPCTNFDSSRQRSVSYDMGESMRWRDREMTQHNPNIMASSGVGPSFDPRRGNESVSRIATHISHRLDRARSPYYY